MGGLNLGGMDLSSLLNNPALMNMVCEFLCIADQHVPNVMSQISNLQNGKKTT
jgi:hypothetical protein